MVAQRSRGPEQVGQTRGFLVGVAAPQRLDAHLAAQRDGVDRVVADRGDADPRGENRGHGVRFGRHVQHGERHVHRLPVIALTTLLRSATCVEELVDELAAPAGRRRSPATASAAGRRTRSRRRSADEIACGASRAFASSGHPDQQRLDVVGQQRPPAGRRREGRSRHPGPARTRWPRPGRDRTPRCGPRAELRKKKASPTGICRASHRAAVQREIGERQIAVGHRAVAQRRRADR